MINNAMSLNFALAQKENKSFKACKDQAKAIDMGIMIHIFISF